MILDVEKGDEPSSFLDNIGELREVVFNLEEALTA